MLVIDDFSEMVSLESLLRRVGFDVMSLAKDVLVNDALVRFHPDLVIASYRGRAVDGAKLAVRLKRLTPTPFVGLVHTGAVPQLSGDANRSVDVFFASPVLPLDVIQSVARLMNQPAEPMIARYEKVANVSLTSGEELVIVGDGEGFERGERIQKPESSRSKAGKGETEWDPARTPGQSPSLRSSRSDRYDQFLEEHEEEPANLVLPHDAAVRAMQKLKKEAEAEKEKLEKIDKEKLEFAKALFEQSSSNPKKR